jgi:hypothetical protein
MTPWLPIAVAAGVLYWARNSGSAIKDGNRPEDFDPVQLRAGTVHELEHTDDVDAAQRIAMHHLAEDSDYYLKLEALGL